MHLFYLAVERRKCSFFARVGMIRTAEVGNILVFTKESFVAIRTSVKRINMLLFRQFVISLKFHLIKFRLSYLQSGSLIFEMKRHVPPFWQNVCGSGSGQGSPDEPWIDKLYDKYCFSVIFILNNNREFLIWVRSSVTCGG